MQLYNSSFNTHNYQDTYFLQLTGKVKALGPRKQN